MKHWPLVGPPFLLLACVISSQQPSLLKASASAAFSSWISSSCSCTLCSRWERRSSISIPLPADTLSSERDRETENWIVEFIQIWITFFLLWSKKNDILMLKRQKSYRFVMTWAWVNDDYRFKPVALNPMALIVQHDIQRPLKISYIRYDIMMFPLISL